MGPMAGVPCDVRQGTHFAREDGSPTLRGVPIWRCRGWRGRGAYALEGLELEGARRTPRRTHDRLRFAFAP
jgi:hypothetical protein